MKYSSDIQENGASSFAKFIIAEEAQFEASTLSYSQIETCENHNFNFDKIFKMICNLLHMLMSFAHLLSSFLVCFCG
jgi:hypothetical protein